ncbi:hypothetical protein ORV05_22625 [Amycolatopsis cynarae]|uniref:Uncharacterized protein n=1 Tax=Amycolatopsis cynarae TaxID=2995223 RepID=A0ABY7AWB1_9PSEU|nr:hypothetical protein [Amycolatopsis sp. HUAS 11-8]WAL63783.1 hypothetical protein ORV05_22625 [Amycolatopsis sp. HUAS 11-8]
MRPALGFLAVVVVFGLVLDQALSIAGRMVRPMYPAKRLWAVSADLLRV